MTDPKPYAVISKHGATNGHEVYRTDTVHDALHWILTRYSHDQINAGFIEVVHDANGPSSGLSPANHRPPP